MPCIESHSTPLPPHPPPTSRQPAYYRKEEARLEALVNKYRDRPHRSTGAALVLYTDEVVYSAVPPLLRGKEKGARAKALLTFD